MLLLWQYVYYTNHLSDFYINLNANFQQLFQNESIEFSTYLSWLSSTSDRSMLITRKHHNGSNSNSWLILNLLFNRNRNQISDELNSPIRLIATKLRIQSAQFYSLFWIEWRTRHIANEMWSIQKRKTIIRLKWIFGAVDSCCS